MNLTLRRGLLIALVILFGVVAARWPDRRSEIDPTPLEWIATARQFGPVGYRDPVGALSPDGQAIAYSEGRYLRVRPVSGGPSLDLAPVTGQIRHLVWRPDNKGVLTDGDSLRSNWVLHDLETSSQQPLFAGRVEVTATLPSGESRVTPIRTLRQPAWSPDGRSIAALVDGRDRNELGLP